MRQTAIPVLLLAGTIAVPAGLARAADESSELEALRRQVEQLSSKLDSVVEADDDSWLTEKRAEEIRGLVNDVLADADTRTSLMQSGMTAGHDGKFYIASADGNWRLNIGGQLQVRWALNSIRDSGPVDPQQWGFEIRRAKLVLTGHVVDPTWQFKVQLAASRNGGGIGLEDAYIKKDFENGLAVRFGQFKGPLLREELVSSSRQLAVDRSLINESYNQARSQGVQVEWKNDALRAHLYYGDGYRTVNTNYQNTAANNGTEFSVAGRLEWMVMGNWKQWKDFTTWSGDDHGLMFGVAGWYQTGASGTANAGQEFTEVTADVSWEFHPFNVFAYGVYNNSSDTRLGVGTTGSRARGWGAVVQAGWHFVPDQWELFGRYEWGDTRGSAAADAVPYLSAATVGVNYYVDRHNAKWTTDFGYALSQVNGFYSSSGVNYRASANTGEYVIRSQFQILF